MATCHSELLAREVQTSPQGKFTDLILELMDGELHIRSDRRTRRLINRSVGEAFLALRRAIFVRP